MSCQDKHGPVRVIMPHAHVIDHRRGRHLSGVNVFCANQARVADMFKSLGCNVDLPTPAEREKMGIKLTEANRYRKATLKAPLKFPKTKRRGPAKR